MADPVPAQAQIIGKEDPNLRADVSSYVRAVFLDMFKTFFAQETLLGKPNPYRWLEDSTKSKIVIAAEYTESQKVVNPNHMILVNRGPIRFIKTMWDNKVQELSSPLIYQAVKQSAPAGTKPGQESRPVGVQGNPSGSKRQGRRYMVMAQTEIQIACFSRLPAEVETIAQCCAMITMMCIDLLKDRAKLHRIENPSIGNETPIQSSDAQIMTTMVSVTVPVYIPYSWMVIRDPVSLVIEPILMQVEDC